MSAKTSRPATLINLIAGLLGLAFDQLEGPSNGTVTDDLTEIDGIGPVFAGRLNEAGVNSFAELATLTPEQVRDITHLIGREGEAAEWIGQAERLAH